ncbi:uncharacterized protein TNCV_5095261 [Trichonephila clavipes]|nr:uncharacterized protein TNCV_5095261 [Trichonephila clavipes]
MLNLSLAHHPHIGMMWNRVPARLLSCQRLYKEPQVIRSNRLRWLGHIWRSPENNQTRTYIFKNPMGSRTRGKPSTRWMDDVENDLKTLNILKTGRELLRIVGIGRSELWRQPRPVTGRETVLVSSFYSQYGLSTISGLPLHDDKGRYRPEKSMTDCQKDLSQLVAIYFVVFQSNP